MFISWLLVEISIKMVNIVDPSEVENWIDHYYDKDELFFIYYMKGFLPFFIYRKYTP